MGAAAHASVDGIACAHLDIERGESQNCTLPIVAWLLTLSQLRLNSFLAVQVKVGAQSARAQAVTS